MKRYIRSNASTEPISDNEAINEANYNQLNKLYKSMPYSDRKLIDPDSTKIPENYIDSLDEYLRVVAYNIVTDDGFLVAEKIPNGQNVDDTTGVEIGIGVIKKGQGLGSKLTAALVDWFYSQDTYDVLWWPVDEANDASIRVAEENGFFRDPMGKNWVLPKGDAYEKLGLEEYQEIGDEDMKRYIRSAKQSRWNKEFEVTCNAITTPKAFWNRVSKAMESHGEDIRDWVESYDQWVKPFQPSKYKETNNYGVTTVSRFEPYEFQLYCSTDYNVILEFDFWDEIKGYGYFYFASNQ